MPNPSFLMATRYAALAVLAAVDAYAASLNLLPDSTARAGCARSITPRPAD